MSKTSQRKLATNQELQRIYKEGFDWAYSQILAKTSEPVWTKAAKNQWDLGFKHGRMKLDEEIEEAKQKEAEENSTETT